MLKNKVLIVIAIIILILLGILAYQVFTPPTATPISTSPGNNFPVARPTSGGVADNVPVTTATTSRPSDTEQELVAPEKRSLFKISKDPTSGYTVAGNSSTTVVRFTDKMSGHSYETALDKVSLNKITITTVPKIYESIWSNNGGYVALRYLNGDTDLIRTFWGKVVNSGTTTINKNLSGSFLPNDITQFATSPAGDKLFFLTNTTDGSLGFTAKNDLTARTQVFNSPAREWLVSWPNDNTLIFNTKPSYAIPGYVFSLNLKTKAFSKLFGEIDGLTTLYNKDTTKLIYSESIDNSLRTIASTKNGKIVLSLKTLPEKCVWSKINDDLVYCAVPQQLPAGDYPDFWYQGQLSFNDDIWSINVSTGETKIISSLFYIGQPNMDAINLQVDKDENYLTFINKKDMQLWGLKLR
ncbi:MAG: hypothetical protein WCO30_00465 [bacterium]